ncbi:hypothetical protein Bca52824_024601 [Brassica carinata]|uniref:Uncharacterized protein n=1 Tax=Brassica carinata TaxID=52824 RepID=A0A8X8ATX9_BRACI|nr:hypothetical protein Bca52824_024601 [Brassica carinata]
MKVRGRLLKHPPTRTDRLSRGLELPHQQDRAIIQTQSSEETYAKDLHKNGVRSSRSSTFCPPGHYTSWKSTSTRMQGDHTLGSSAGMTGSNTWKHETRPHRMTQRIRKSRHGDCLRTRETDRHEQNHIGSMKNNRIKDTRGES